MNIEPKPLQHTERQYSFREMLASGIVIGSIARGEFSPLYAGYDNLQKILLQRDEFGNMYWCDCDYNNNPISDWIPLDQYSHPDMILDAHTTNPDYVELLREAKCRLTIALLSKTKSRIKSSFTLAKSNIRKNGEYKIKGQSYIQYDLEEEMYYLDSEYHKSVKYTYLRALQLFLIRLLLTYTPEYFQDGSKPSTRSKLQYLLDKNILNAEEAEQLMTAYEETLLIYAEGVQEFYSEGYPNRSSKIEYKVVGSRVVLVNIEYLIEVMSSRFFSQKGNNVEA